MKIDEKKLKEFLKESNHIEREYDLFAHEDAYKAWKFLESFDGLTISRILEVHSILMENLNPRIAGRIRNCNVRVGYKICPNPGSLNRLMYTWIDCHGKAKTEEEIKLAHIVFEGIHPFEDGNGRTGRIIMNWQRAKNGLPILVIHEGDEQRDYYKWFNK